jgi:VWFA-related protein
VESVIPAGSFNPSARFEDKEPMMLKASHKTVLPLVLVLSLLLAAGAAAQSSTSLTIHQVDDSQFPSLTAFLTVTDASGQPLEGLDPVDFSLSEDGTAIPSFSLTENPPSDLPITVVLVLDASYSMVGQPLADVQASAESFVNSLGEADQVGVIVFSGSVETISPITDDQASVTAAIGTIEASGGSPIYDALVQAVNALRSLPQGRKAIILLTDGRDEGSIFTFQEAIQEAQSWSIPIYPIGFGGVNENTIQRIAALTSGYAQIQPDSASLSEAFETVLGVLRHHYALEFTSSFPADGNPHTLTVALDHLGAQLTGTYQFNAQPGTVGVELPGMAPGDEIGGIVSLEPVITAPGEVESVTFLLDDVEFEPTNISPLNYSWDASAVPTGPHTLSIVAEDGAGNQGQLDLEINIRPAIIIEWTNPVPGGEVSQSPELTVDIDSLNGIATVAYYVDGTELATLTSPPYSVEWPLDDVEAGTHDLRVVVTDQIDQVAENENRVTVSLQSGGLILGLAALVIIAAAGILIPVANRRRKALAGGAGLAAGGSAQLAELEGRNPGTVWTLGPGETHIGRKAADNDIHAAGLSASRQHATIRRTESGYILANLKPENPSYINGMPVTQQQKLQPGDEVQIGESRFRFERSANPEAGQ